MIVQLPVPGAPMPPTKPLHVASLPQHSLTEYRQQIGATVETMMEVGANYDRSRGEALGTAVSPEWIIRLEGWKLDQIHDAFRAWQDREPNRRPSPTHVVAILNAEWGKQHVAQTRAALAKPVEPPKQRISAEAHERILNEFGGMPAVPFKTIDGIKPTTD